MATLENYGVSHLATVMRLAAALISLRGGTRSRASCTSLEKRRASSTLTRSLRLILDLNYINGV